MKLSSHRLQLFHCCALLITCSLVLPLRAVSSRATHHFQQQHTPAASTSGTQAATNAASGSLRFPVTVMNEKGAFMVGLSKGNFSVWEGKTEREINYFSSENLPASIGILIDVSGSIRPPLVELAKYAAARFIEHSSSKNEYLIGEFNDEWRASSGWRRDATAAIDALNIRSDTDPPKSQRKKTRGDTAFYDACADALDEVVRRPNPRHVLLLITDGQDNRSRITFTELRKKIQASDVQIHVITLMDSDGLNELAAIGQRILEEFATLSGGRAYFPETKIELDEVMERIAKELQSQYIIGFTPTNAAPAGKWNKVRIKLTPPLNQPLKKLYLQNREGYFSPNATP